jgi:hypothetical protein
VVEENMSKPLVEEVVRKARGLVAQRGKRARGIEAVNSAGEECDACGSDVVRFCAVGALIRSAFELTGDWERSHSLGWNIAGMVERANGLATEDDDGYGLVNLSDMKGGVAVVKAFDVFLAARR